MFKNVTDTELNRLLYFMKMRYNSKKNGGRKKAIKQMITDMEKETQKRMNKNGDK